METRKRYYEDCHLGEFTARVLRCSPVKNGWEVVLDETCFYPEGGGQPCDRGSLGKAKVLDVRERGEAVIHLCDSSLEENETVRGVIDYARRFDFMQQHTGEHIVSGIVSRRFGYHNVGFHMGADLVTIDFDGPISQEALAEIEAEANRLLWQNLPVKCWYPSREELPTVPYRSKRELPWPVRVVEIPGADCCACCGVHTAATGEVGLVKLFTCVKFHQGVRIEMACGGRALSLLSRIFEENRRVSQAFSVKWLETGDAAQRMNDQLGQEKFRSAGLQRQIFGSIAEGYAGKEQVLHFDPALEPGQVRLLAETIAGRISGVAAVAGGDEGDFSLCLMGPADRVADLGQRLRQQGARGGGKAGVWQGKASMAREQLERLFWKTL